MAGDPAVPRPGEAGSAPAPGRRPLPRRSAAAMLTPRARRAEDLRLVSAACGIASGEPPPPSRARAQPAWAAEGNAV